MAFNTNYHDTGLFGVYAVVEKEQHTEDVVGVGLPLLTQELKDLLTPDQMVWSSLEIRMCCQTSSGTQICSNVKATGIHMIGPNENTQLQLSQIDGFAWYAQVWAHNVFASFGAQFIFLQNLSRHVPTINEVA